MGAVAAVVVGEAEGSVAEDSAEAVAIVVAADTVEDTAAAQE